MSACYYPSSRYCYPYLKGVAMKSLTMEFLNSLATRGGGMVRMAKGFAPKVVPLAFQFMLELEHDDDAWGKGTEETDMECEGYSVGVESIDRLACALGAKVFNACLLESYLVSQTILLV